MFLSQGKLTLDRESLKNKAVLKPKLVFQIVFDKQGFFSLFEKTGFKVSR